MEFFESFILFIYLGKQLTTCATYLLKKLDQRVRLSRGKKTSRKTLKLPQPKRRFCQCFFHWGIWSPHRSRCSLELLGWQAMAFSDGWMVTLGATFQTKKKVGAKWRGTTWWIKTFTVIHVQNSVFVCCIFFVCLWCLRGEEFQEYDMLGVVVSFDHLLKTPKTPGLTACWMSGARRNWWICVPATRVPCQGVSNTHVSYRYD